MTLDLETIRRSPFYRVIIAQSIATLVVAVLVVVICRIAESPANVCEAAALSAIAAGGVCVIPGLYLLLMSTRRVAKGTTGLALALKGEAGRFVLSGICFVAVFLQFRGINELVFFGLFIGLQAFHVIVPLFGRQEERPAK